MELIEFIKSALKEDIREGDHTTLACIPEHAVGKAKLLVKENGIIAGVEMAKMIFHELDSTIIFEELISDGADVKKGEIAFCVEGRQQSLLTAERTVLNCMQRMSGIATHTNRLVKHIFGTKAKLLDTRKTTPNARVMEKWAVRIGGGINHRMGLYDMIMIKDNHVDYAGSIEKAIVSTVEYLINNKLNLKIEVEARTLAEVKSIIKCGHTDRILLDNFRPNEMKNAIDYIAGSCETEASGGITEENIRLYAATGVDFISVGALTHYVKSIDMSLKAEK